MAFKDLLSRSELCVREKAVSHLLRLRLQTNCFETNCSKKKTKRFFLFLFFELLRLRLDRQSSQKFCCC